MRKKTLLINGIVSVLNRIIFAICGLILPRFILLYYGSEVNGLVSSIMQFLGLISFMEFGVGTVVQTALYKPLAENNEVMISQILISARQFFRYISFVFIVYVIMLMFLYPVFLNQSFEPLYINSLIIILSIGSFSEYCFGLVNQLLLYSDQKIYICMLVMGITQIFNVIICIILIQIGASIQLVKLFSSIIFLIKPLFYSIYVNKYYNIDYTIKLDSEPIKQKWNGLTQHVSAVIVGRTDVVILTFFSTLKNVSVYSVYYMIINSIELILANVNIAIQSALGNLIARNERTELKKTFYLIEIIMHMIITALYSTCLYMIIPFINIYTNGISDTNYIMVEFSCLMCAVGYVNSIRNMYHTFIKAEGAFKETQASAIIEAIMNITLSIILVCKLGLIGVAVGTILSGIYRIIYFSIFISKKYLNRSLLLMIKSTIVDGMSIGIICFVGKYFQHPVANYYEWVLLAVKITMIAIFCSFLVSFAAYNRMWKAVLEKYVYRKV